MKTLRSTRLLTAIAAIFLCLSFTSCVDDDDPYYSPLVGQWLSTTDYTSFTFYDNGTGVYQDTYGYYYDMRWSSYSRDNLRISFPGGDVWYYDYWFDRNGDLILDDGYYQYRYCPRF